MYTRERVICIAKNYTFEHQKQKNYKTIIEEMKRHNVDKGEGQHTSNLCASKIKSLNLLYSNRKGTM